MPAAAEPELPSSPDPTSQLGNNGRGQALNAPVGVSGARQGVGIALTDDGRSRLHLRLDAGAGFDTNPYSVPFESPSFVGDAVTRIRPGFDIVYPGSTVSIDGGLFVDYGFLPGAVNPSTQQFLLYNSAADVGLEVNRGGAFSFAVAESLAWANTPGVASVGSVFNRLTNTLNAGLGFRPGGGTLAMKLGYTFNTVKWLDIFGSDSQLVRDGVLDNMTHTATLRADWRFLPRTGLFVQASGGFNHFPFQTSEVNTISFPVSVQAGLMGQLTPKISGIASAGYQDPLIVRNGEVVYQDFLRLAGQLEARWEISPNMKLGGGVQRRVIPVAIYDYAVDNRLYVVFNQSLGAKMNFALNAGFSALEFGQEQEINGTPVTTVAKDERRLDGQLDLRANLSYHLYDWLSLGVANNLEWRMTGANAYSITNDGINLSYLSNETLLLASLHY